MVSTSESGEHLGRNGRDVRDSLLLKNTRSQALTLATGELMNSGSAASLEMPFPVLMEAGDGPGNKANKPHFPKNGQVAGGTSLA